MRIHHSLIIERPCAEVFAFVTDLRNETRWQPEILEVRVDGPLAVDQTFHETRVSFGLRFDWRFRITDFAPPHRIEIETISGRAPYRGARVFEDLGPRTRVSEIGELELPWPLRAFDPWLERLAIHPVREAYARLRGLLEDASSSAPTSC